MTWNYRVVRLIEPDGSAYYEIREAYYDGPNDTHPHSITAEGVRAGGETLLSLRKDLTLMLAAFDKAPLNDRDFSGQAPAQPLSADAVDPSATNTGTPSTRAEESLSSPPLAGGPGDADQ